MWLLWWLSVAVVIALFSWGFLRVMDAVGLNPDEKSTADYARARAALKRRQARERHGRDRCVIYLQEEEKEAN